MRGGRAQRGSGPPRKLIIAAAGVLLCLASVPAFASLLVDKHEATPLQPREQTYSCGGPSFPRSALHNALGVEKSDDPAARALVRFVRSFEGIEFPLNGSWRELVRTPDMVLFGRGTPGRVTHVIRVEKSVGSWKGVGGGGCTPTLLVPGYRLPTWVLRRKPSPKDKTLRLILETGSCHPDRAGPEARARFDHVEATRRDRAIRLILFEREDPAFSKPGFVCPGVGISYPIDVRLPYRIGRRLVRNAATAPSTVVRYDERVLAGYGAAIESLRAERVRARTK